MNRRQCHTPTKITTLGITITSIPTWQAVRRPLQSRRRESRLPSGMRHCPTARTENNEQHASRDRDDRDRSPAWVSAHRQSHCQRREHAVAMINKNAAPWTQPFHVSGSPPLSIGASTRNPASISATPSSASSMTAKPGRPPPRQLIEHRDGEDDDQQARGNEGRNLRPPVRSACQRTRPRHLLAAHEFQPS